MSHRNLTFMTLALGLTGAACAADQGLPPAEELAQGVTILEADPAYGVTGAYRDGDDVVYFETRVGYTKPAIYLEAFPDEPAQEMDMRFVDRNGLTFFVQRGGDEYVDPTWNDGINQTFGTSPVADDDRARDFALAQAAGRAFPQSAGPGLAAHTFHLRAHGERLLPSEDPAMIARAAAIQEAPRDEAYATWAPTGWWYLEADMYHSSVAVFGTHGSVALWGWPDGGTAWQLVMNACNHGTCAGGGSYKCTTTGGWRNFPVFNAETSTSTGTVSGACSTSYHWDGGTNKHNSNDDTAYEMWQAKEGVTNTSRGNASTFSWDASNKHYQCNGNNGRWTAPANCP